MEVNLFNDLLTFTINQLTGTPVEFVNPSKGGKEDLNPGKLNSNYQRFKFK